MWGTGSGHQKLGADLLMTRWVACATELDATWGKDLPGQDFARTLS